LKDVLVGEKSTMDALAVLVMGSSASDKELNEALVRFALMTSEAARFTSVRVDVISAWEKEHGDHLGSTSIDLTVKWNLTRCALIVWKREDCWSF
jgi:hypothetical protein